MAQAGDISSDKVDIGKNVVGFCRKVRQEDRRDRKLEMKKNIDGALIGRWMAESGHGFEFRTDGTATMIMPDTNILEQWTLPGHEQPFTYIVVHLGLLQCENEEGTHWEINYHISDDFLTYMAEGGERHFMKRVGNKTIPPNLSVQPQSIQHVNPTDIVFLMAEGSIAASYPTVQAAVEAGKPIEQMVHRDSKEAVLVGISRIEDFTLLFGQYSSSHPVLKEATPAKYFRRFGITACFTKEGLCSLLSIRCSKPTENLDCFEGLILIPPQFFVRSNSHLGLEAHGFLNELDSSFMTGCLPQKKVREDASGITWSYRFNRKDCGDAFVLSIYFSSSNTNDIVNLTCTMVGW
jgi:hypothetical protein